ncbi:HECT [Macleaya cordata]|uniref:HECT-type E3 ubiquitin transferase n=1 Tax=Macleaya cordata TaxID=56857 RepID=A0A200QL29_MACCD|nr:HECT [Macleaya cordata]
MMIPRDNMKKSMEHLQIFKFYGAPEALVPLFESPIEGNKEIEATDFIKDLYPFFFELSSKLLEGLVLIKSQLPCARAIEDHVRSKCHSLPLNVEADNFKEHPCYGIEIESLHRDVFFTLLLGLNSCLYGMRRDIGDGEGAEEEFSSDIQAYPVPIGTLIAYSKRSDDNLWLLKHKGLTESFKHIANANPKSLRNGLLIEFKYEVATGRSILREWLCLICQELFNPQNSLFLACPNDRRRFFPYPANDVDPRHLTYFRLCGRVIALALMHNIQVGIAFDRMFFLQLAGEVISLEDVRYADPCMYILEMDVDFMDSDAMGLTFVNEIEEFGSRKIVELCPGGNTIIVNSKNREKYVDLLIQHCFVKSISKKVAHFARGFGDILYKRRQQKIFFQSFELEDLDRMLLGSDKTICVKDWKAHTDYDDYKETDDQICWFWKVVEGMSSEQQKGATLLLDLGEVPSGKWFFWFAISFVHLQDIRLSLSPALSPHMLLPLGTPTLPISSRHAAASPFYMPKTCWLQLRVFVKHSMLCFF